MAKSVGGRGEGVEDGRVDLAVVVVGEALAGGEDVQLSHEVRPEHDGQPLVVVNMLAVAGHSQTQSGALQWSEIEMFLTPTISCHKDTAQFCAVVMA